MPRFYHARYDAENRMGGFYNSGLGTSESCGYDAQNKRVWKWTGTVDGNGNARAYTVYAYGPNGKRIGTYSVDVYTNFLGVPNLGVASGSGLAYFGGRLLNVQDRLGSARQGQSFYPYGEDKAGNPGRDALNFSTYSRDGTSGLDYADQRFYANHWGRFMSPDPYQASGGVGDPGSWNRYVYSGDDPTNNLDPSGLSYITSFDWSSFTSKPSSTWAFSFSSQPLFLDVDTPIPLYVNVINQAPARRALARSGQGWDSVRDQIYQEGYDGNVTASIMDCMAGIESRWKPDAKNGGHRGFIQMDTTIWKESGTRLSYDNYVKNATASVAVAVAGLYRKLSISFGSAQAEYVSHLSRGVPFTADRIHQALASWRGSSSATLNNHYADAIINCSKQMDAGNYQKGSDWIYEFGAYEASGKWK